MSPTSKALATASAAAARAIQADDLLHPSPTDYSPASSEASTGGLRSPTPAPTLDSGASEDSLPQEGPATPLRSPVTPPSSGSASPTSTPAPVVDSATCGVSGGRRDASVGSASSNEASPAVLAEQSLCELAKLVAGVMRQPLPRVHSRLDQRLDEASSVSEVLAATIAPYRLPPHESEELIDLRTRWLGFRRDEAEHSLATEVGLRTTAEANDTRSNEDFYTMPDSSQSLRSPNEHLVDRIRDLDATVARQVYVLQQLNDRYGTSEAD
ncbi:LOW QUALITY PROTEIN: hypothetical protein PHMEG_00018390 [Phytophthora megakarya]|uniref:Uncharacterized protein n=1 Tax=Phytophthora megakarya TaxID=4795 RepID=A0A225VWP7_9STRA|nr:LOW QUALITY PROTEIN: hypothetical protein PHMEG_00018390 [Phytophthora megakarya]